MIHLFHGFLGSPSDLAFIKSQSNICRYHDLYSEDFSTLMIGPEDILIGYSMGGRVAMEVALRNHFQLKKLVVMNSHPGLPLEETRGRSLWEDSVIERLKTLSKEDFLHYWNSLELFSADQPLTELSEDTFQRSQGLFEKYRLSQQKCFLPELGKNHDKVLWLAGTRDTKYAELARRLIAPLNIRCVFIEGGHRLYQHPKKILDVLENEEII